jgi:putative redox protein
VDNDRHHGLVIDLPEAKSGDDLGPTALELAVMGLSGCISTIWAVVAGKARVSYHSVRVELEADKPDDAPTITAVRAKVYVNSEASKERLEKILDQVMKTCPVGQLYEKAGVQIETELIKEE